MERHWKDGHSRAEGSVCHKNPEWEKSGDLNTLFPKTVPNIKFKECRFLSSNVISLWADHLLEK